MKAIETEYKGVLFRSRLEARWAVFFDALGIDWQYEPEGFDLADGTRYLPDFGLQIPGGGSAWFEVKPSEHRLAHLVEMVSKPEQLARESGEQVLLVFGEPGNCRLFVCGNPRCRLQNPEFFMVCRFAAEPFTESRAVGAANEARTHRFWNPKERR